MPVIFADTSFIVALLRINDEIHARALELLPKIRERVVISDHVLAELVTFLAYRDGNAVAYSCAKKLLESEILIVQVVNEDILPALKLVRKYGKLSMCDALSAVVMKNLGIGKALSFDSDFDRLGFERVF